MTKKISEMKVESGTIEKMKSSLNNGMVDYFLPIGSTEIHMNPLIGQHIELKHNGEIYCINCSAKTNKSFGQGYCYSCFLKVPEADESVVRPELSKAQFGISRNIEWSLQHDLIDHFVYLSVTSELKVGVTRYHQVPTRWIDQGAVAAIKLAQTPNRHIAGIIEVFLKQFVSDKTAWQAMLKAPVIEGIDLATEKNKLAALLPAELRKYVTTDNLITEITYPVEKYPEKISSFSFDNIRQIEGILTGIKGQYLLFDNGGAFNVRKHNGYFTEIIA
jgi:hypothetical protein